MTSPAFLCFLSVIFLACYGISASKSSFGENYEVIWGDTHVSLPNQGETQLSMDHSSGSGFASRLNYSSGYFSMRIKLSDKNSAGVVTAYYLTSKDDTHDELDFEFLGNKVGKPIMVQTNVFVNGKGNREQRIKLWFDPTQDFHNYTILWNPYQTVFFVDNIPIRVFKNKRNKGVDYPRTPMQVVATIWNGEDWATDGGKTKIDWTQAPFKASFQGFDINGCPFSSSSSHNCYGSNLWWNGENYKRLSLAQRKAYNGVKKNYMTYDYCADTHRYPTPPPECPQ